MVIIHFDLILGYILIVTWPFFPSHENDWKYFQKSDFLCVKVLVKRIRQTTRRISCIKFHLQNYWTSVNCMLFAISQKLNVSQKKNKKHDIHSFLTWENLYLWLTTATLIQYPTRKQCKSKSIKIAVPFKQI